MMRILVQIGLVALGSALGGLARWGVGAAAARLLGTAFPYGTLLVNLTGTLFLGWFLAAHTERLKAGEGASLYDFDLRLLLVVGFAGAYTTFSTFEWETHSMLRDGDALAAAIYVLASVLLGLIAIRLGVHLARMA